LTKKIQSACIAFVRDVQAIKKSKRDSAKARNNRNLSEGKQQELFATSKLYKLKESDERVPEGKQATIEGQVCKE